MKRLKIQIFSTYYAPETTGNAPYVTGLAQGLASRGHHVKVTCGAPHYPEWKLRSRSEWSPKEYREGLEVARVTSYVPLRPNFVNRIAYEVGFGLKLAHQIDPDADIYVLVSPTLFGSLVVRLGGLLGRRRAPWMLWIQDLYSAGVRETPGIIGRLSHGLISRAEGWLARSVDHVVVIHERFRSAVASLGVASRRISVIRNWTHVTPAPGPRAKLRDHLGWPEQAVVVAHAGNQGAKQGLTHVVRAARHASQNDLPLLFLMVGDGNQRADLEKLSAGLPTIRFVDSQTDAQFMETLAAADVLLVNERPSLREAAVPSKLTTYFATGRPVLAATDRDSATADELRASGAGVLVSPDDPEGLCATAIELAGKGAQEIGANGPRYVREVLSKQAALVAFETILMQHVEDATGANVEPSALPEERATT